MLERARTFEEFLLHCSDDIVDSDGRKNIFRNQIDYLIDDNGAIMVDFIGRYERLQDGFNTVSDRLGRPAVELQRTNASEHRPYIEYYTPTMVDMVAQRYARDIEAFGYRFGA